MEQFPHNEEVDFNKKLNVKFGIDPTADRLHLGHLIPLRFAKKMLDNGHNLDIVLGTFTAQLGDPSGKDSMRPMLDSETTKDNAIALLPVIRRILKKDFNLHFNHEWFKRMNAIDMVNILSKFTANQLLSRDSFQKRISNEDGIGMHELTVPILQGFDSVHLKTDIEIGGNDQLFNFKITRDLQRAFDQKPEVCMLMPIINGTDGRKMSKTFKNCIFLDDSPIDVFGKTMSISDELMKEWFMVFMDESIGHPMEAKKKLAFQITKEVWDENEAKIALEHFERVIQKKNIPIEIKDTNNTDILKVIMELRSCSATEARRLLSQGAVKVNDEKALEEKTLSSGDIVKVGKLNFAKIM